MNQLQTARKLIGKLITIEVFGESSELHQIEDISEIHRSINFPYDLDAITFRTSYNDLRMPMVVIHELLKNGKATNQHRDILYTIEE